jgi:hypothetical protein
VELLCRPLPTSLKHVRCGGRAVVVGVELAHSIGNRCRIGRRMSRPPSCRKREEGR